MGINEFLKQRRKRKFKKKYRVGLCLSGGGTRGFSYLGVFKAFEELGIEFDMVAGTSAGSLFGAMYASKMNFDEMYTLTRNMTNKDFRNSKLGILPSKMDNLYENLSKILPYNKIEKLPIKYFAVAVDVKTGKEMQFSSGDLQTIITASCAIPMVYYPVKYKGMNLVDGGVTNNFPADVLKDNDCDFIVGVDCNCNRGKGTESNNMISQFMTTIGIMMSQNAGKNVDLVDIMLCPNTKRFSSLNLAGKDEMIEEGYKETMAHKDELLKLFDGKIKKKKNKE